MICSIINAKKERKIRICRNCWIQGLATTYEEGAKLCGTSRNTFRDYVKGIENPEQKRKGKALMKNEKEPERALEPASDPEQMRKGKAIMKYEKQPERALEPESDFS